MARSIPVGGIFISITGNSADFRKAVKTARSEIYKLRAAFKPLAGVARSAGIALAAAGGTALVMGKNLAEGIDQLGKLSTSLNTSVADLQAFKLAAGLEGVDFTKATNGLLKLQVVLGKISDGTAYKEVTDQWDKLGLRIEDVIDLPVAEQFEAITRAAKENVRVSEQATTLASFFGARQAAALLRVSNSTEKARKAVKDYELALSQTEARGVEAMNDAMLTLRLTFQGFAEKLVASYAPAVTAWVEELQAGLKPGGDLRELLKSLADGFRVVARTAANFGDIVSSIVTRERLMTAAMLAIALAGWKVVAAFSKATLGLVGFVAQMKTATTVMGTMGAVMGLGAGGLGGILATLFAAGGIVAGGVALYRALNTEMETGNEHASDASAYVDQLRKNYDMLTTSMAEAGFEQSAYTKELKASSAAMLEAMKVSNARARLAKEAEFADRDAELKGIEQRLAVLTRPGLRGRARKTTEIDALRRRQRELLDERQGHFADVVKAETDAMNLENAFANPGAASNTVPGSPTRLTIGGGAGGAAGNGLAAYYEHQTSLAAAAIAKAAEANRKAAEESRQVWQSVGASIKSSLGGTIDGIIDGVNDLGDVADNVLKTLAKMAVKAAILGPLGAGGLGIPGFASGGRHAGGWALVGEQGPELINTGPGRVYNNRDTRRMMGGGMNINISLEAANDRALGDRIRAELDNAVPKIVELSKSSTVSDMNRPSQMNSAVRGS